MCRVCSCIKGSHHWGWVVPGTVPGRWGAVVPPGLDEVWGCSWGARVPSGEGWAAVGLGALRVLAFMAFSKTALQSDSSYTGPADSDKCGTGPFLPVAFDGVDMTPVRNAGGKERSQ